MILDTCSYMNFLKAPSILSLISFCWLVLSTIYPIPKVIQKKSNVFIDWHLQLFIVVTRPQDTFDFLSAYCHSNEQLLTVFDTTIICEIDDWRIKQNLSRIENKKNRKRFVVKIDSILSYVVKKLCRVNIWSGSNIFPIFTIQNTAMLMTN